MDILFMILAIIFAVIGVLGAIVPVLPGPPLSFVALLLFIFCEGVEISPWTLWIMGFLMVVLTVFDYIAPPWFTKLKGGSKSATTGSMIGLIIGLFIMPWGLILGPFIGAFIGEIIAKSSQDKAFKVALVSFYAFVLTTGLKLIYGAVVLIIVMMKMLSMGGRYINEWFVY